MADNSEEIIDRAEEGDVRGVSQMLDADPGLVNVSDPRTGLTPLLVAAKEGHSELVCQLIDNYSAFVGQSDNTGNTALHLACEEGCADTAKELLDRGADAWALTADGDSPLMLGVTRGDDVITKLLLAHPNGAKNSEMVNARDNKGKTALWEACRQGATRSFRRLIEAGADPGIPDFRGRDLLLVSEIDGNDDCWELLWEWERTYVLCRGRRIRDAVFQITKCCSPRSSPRSSKCEQNYKRRLDAAPAWLKRRVEEQLPLPRIEGPKCEEFQSNGRRRKLRRLRKKGIMQSAAAADEVDEEKREELSATACYVLYEMKAVLFVELLETMGRIPGWDRGLEDTMDDDDNAAAQWAHWMEGQLDEEVQVDDWVHRPGDGWVSLDNYYDSDD